MVITDNDARYYLCHRNVGLLNCVGSSCMAWVFLEQKYGEESDYSGRISEVALPREGYCGLVYPKPLSTNEVLING